MVAATFPDPPTDLVVDDTDCTVVPADRVLWRLVFTGATHALRWNTQRSYGPCVRFDPHPEPAGDHPGSGVWYGAEDPVTTIGECFQRDHMIDLRADAPVLYAGRLGRDVRLLDLTSPSTWIVRAGGHHGLAHAEHPVAQRWARAIVAAAPDLDGVRYRSSYGPGPSMVLFAPAADALASARLEMERPLGHPGLIGVVTTAAAQLGYQIS